jgi:hypothetical protein
MPNKNSERKLYKSDPVTGAPEFFFRSQLYARNEYTLATGGDEGDDSM